MKYQTPDELHKALTGQVVRLDGHPANEAIICMRCEQVVITAMRSMPTAPQTWYSASDVAYLVKAKDVGRLANGLRSFGAVVIGEAAPLNSPTYAPGPDGRMATARMYRAPGSLERLPYPEWCGECDERTRLREVDAPAYARAGDHSFTQRCRKCHPLRDEESPGRRREEDPDPMDPADYQRHVRELRAQLHAMWAQQKREVQDAEEMPF